MSIHAHLNELKKKHQALSEQVEEEQRALGSDDLTVAAMKKQKLRLKEEITKLSN